MSRSLLARVPVLKLRLDYSGTNVTTAAWVVFTAALAKSASGVEIYNGSGSTVKISTGTTGQEDSNEVPYYVLPGGSSILLPMEFARNARITVRAVDADATTGSLIMNFFG